MERSLVERARAGDRDAFDALVRRKVDAVYRTAYVILGDSADAEDATQEAFLAAWRAMPQLREIDRFDAWLGRIVRNACRMTIRRGRSRVRTLDLAGVKEPAGHDSTGDVLDAQAFDRAFDGLTVDQRALLVAHHLDGTELETLSDELGIPVGTVKSRLHTARAALARGLEAER